MYSCFLKLIYSLYLCQMWSISRCFSWLWTAGIHLGSVGTRCLCPTSRSSLPTVTAGRGYSTPACTTPRRLWHSSGMSAPLWHTSLMQRASCCSGHSMMWVEELGSTGSNFILKVHLKSFIAKRVNTILVNLRDLRFKLLKYKENNKKNFNTFDHNFKSIPLYIMRKVSLERYYFVLYNGAILL